MRAEPAATARIRPLALPEDVALLHRWFTMERANFWGMQHLSAEQVEAAYRGALATGHLHAWMGSFDPGAPAFLFEAYDPAFEEVGQHYPVLPGDLGMHCFVGPPRGAPVPGFTRQVFRAVMRFLFDDRQAQRVVVEPDLHNRKVHALNRDMGFTYQRALALRHKRAALAFCSREDFFALHPIHDPRKEPAA